PFRGKGKDDKGADAGVPQPRTIGGKKVYEVGPLVWPADDRTFVIGDPANMVQYLTDLADTGNGHAFAADFQLPRGQHTLVLAVRASHMLQQADADDRASRARWREKDKAAPRGKDKEFKEDRPRKDAPRQRPAPREEPLKLRELDEILGHSWEDPF